MPLLEEYAERKRAREALDFGDQLALAARLARDFPDIGRAERARTRTVLLDEFQDTSHAQLVMLRALFGGGHSVTAVGDPHQSIYGWRGASAGTLARFAEQFADVDGSPATRLTLSTSWRNDRPCWRWPTSSPHPCGAAASGRGRGTLPLLTRPARRRARAGSRPAAG